MHKKPYAPVESWQRHLSRAEAEAKLRKESDELGIPISLHWQERWDNFLPNLQSEDKL